MGIVPLVIADDMTGAMESALCAFVSGRRAFVRFPWTPGGYPTREEGIPEGALRIIDTETRNLPEHEAERRIAAVVEGIGAAPFYKKIDSTLRGNISAELRGLGRTFRGEGCEAPLAILCPALPVQGRTVSRSRLFVHGVPLEETEYARDPLKPARSGDLLSLLTEAGLECASLGLKTVRSGARAIGAEIRRLVLAGVGGLAVDAESEADLAVLASALMRLDDDEVWKGSLPLGSAGLLGAFMPRAILGVRASGAKSAAPRLAATSPAEPRTTEQPRVIIISGSMSSFTEAQLERLRSGCDPKLFSIYSTTGLRVFTESFDDAVKKAAREAETELRGAREAVLLLIGGHTAQIALETLGVDEAEVVGEAAPLVPICRARGGPAGLRFLTKAGGFGGFDFVSEIVENVGRGAANVPFRA